MTPRKTSQTPAPRSAPGAGDAARPPQAAPLAGGAPVPLASPTSLAGAAEGAAPAGGDSSGARNEARTARAPEIHISGVMKTSDHSWTLYFPAGMELLNSNQRLHWSRKGAITKQLRTASWALARNNVPQLDRVRIVIEYQPPKVTRKRDAGNLSPSGKALIDGLRDAKVLIDDDSEHVLEEAYRIGHPFAPLGRIVMHITEVLDGPP